MIKRADGSTSQRGLWDNIRANKGSGKKPTAAMLKQEKKIKTKAQDGGFINKGKRYKNEAEWLKSTIDQTNRSKPKKSVATDSSASKSAPPTFASPVSKKKMGGAITKTKKK